MTTPLTCAGKCRVHPTFNKAAGDCWSCWQAAPKPVPKPTATQLPCVHVGQDAGPKGWFVCEHDDEPLGIVVCTCKGCGPRCPGYAAAEQPAPAGTLAPVRVTRVSPDRGAEPKFNAGLVRYDGRLLCAYRAGGRNSNVWVCELTGDGYVWGAAVKLDLTHPRAAAGREDPRLFVHEGRLHVSFAGLGEPSGPASVLYARLTDDLTVDRVAYPEYEHRPAWEKNWGFFSHDDELFAVHSIRPHVVYRVAGGGGAYPAFGTPNTLPWSGGALRGGAPPVRAGDEYVCWFHGQVPSADRRVLVYTVGVYAFEARPPFRVTRMTPDPVMVADVKTRPAGWNKAVVFPCGAVLEGDRWLVSYGLHDRHVEVAEFDAGAVDAALHGLPAGLAAEIEATQALPGWCTAQKAREMTALILKERPAVVVEIGVFGGRSLLPQAMACRAAGTGVVYGIDPWTHEAADEGVQPGTEWWRSEPLHVAKGAYLVALDRHGLGPWVRTLETTSDAAAAGFAPGSIDVLHVDGNHSEAVSSRDVRTYLPLVRAGGHVWMDDTDWVSTRAASALLGEACDVVADRGTYRLYRKR